jgi:hypothetical protein
MGGQAGNQGSGQIGREQSPYGQPTLSGVTAPPGGYQYPQQARGTQPTYGQPAQPTGLVAMGQPQPRQSASQYGGQPFSPGIPNRPPPLSAPTRWTPTYSPPQTWPQGREFPNRPPNPSAPIYDAPGSWLPPRPAPPSPWDPTGQSVFGSGQPAQNYGNSNEWMRDILGSGQPAQQPQNYGNSDEWMRDILNGTPRRGSPPQPAPWDPTGQNVFGSGQPTPPPAPPPPPGGGVGAPGETPDGVIYGAQWNQDQRYGNMTRPVPGRPNWVTQGGIGARPGSQGLSGLMGRG